MTTPQTAASTLFQLPDPRVATYEKYEQLCQQLRLHATLYYVMDDPQITDAEYDELFRWSLYWDCRCNRWWRWRLRVKRTGQTPKWTR